MLASYFVVLAALGAIAHPVTTEEVPQSYANCTVVRIPLQGNVRELKSLVDKLALQVWQPIKDTPRSGGFVDFVLPLRNKAAWDSGTTHFSSEIMHRDLGSEIEAEKRSMVRYGGDPNSKWFDSYHSYGDHLDFLHDLRVKYPRNSNIVSSGCSYEGRNITGIHVHGSTKGKRPAVVLHATVHAREWITTMVVEYVAYSLLTGKGSQYELHGLLDNYDFYIFPFVNPDGFVYTQKHDRLWRKNRQPNRDSSCMGVDINRNWPHKWDVPGGASKFPCDDDFRGYSAGSTPEAKSLALFLKNIKRKQGLKLYWDFHSYSQLFMTPYGYSCTALSSKSTEYLALAKGASKAIKAVHGTEFAYGPICETIYQASGGSVDFAADEAKADYSVTTELRDQGRYGFLLPASKIVPTCEEMLAGFRYVLANVK